MKNRKIKSVKSVKLFIRILNFSFVISQSIIKSSTAWGCGIFWKSTYSGWNAKAFWRNMGGKWHVLSEMKDVPRQSIDNRQTQTKKITSETQRYRHRLNKNSITYNLTHYTLFIPVLQWVSHKPLDNCMRKWLVKSHFNETVLEPRGI